MNANSTATNDLNEEEFDTPSPASDIGCTVNANSKRDKPSTDAKSKFPVVLLKVDMNIPLGDKIMMFLLKHAKAYGGYDEAFGHRKKTKFLDNSLEHLFSPCGPLN